MGAVGLWNANIHYYPVASDRRPAWSAARAGRGMRWRYSLCATGRPFPAFTASILQVLQLNVNLAFLRQRTVCLFFNYLHKYHKNMIDK
jgi:hypothetical protein